MRDATSNVGKMVVPTRLPGLNVMLTAAPAVLPNIVAATPMNYQPNVTRLC